MADERAEQVLQQSVTMGQVIDIGGRAIASGKPCLIIGEVGQAHDGSLSLAHAFIDAIASAGADAVKFQTHIAEAESTAREPFRVRFSTQDTTRYSYWKRTAFAEDQWHELARHARERGLVFLSSPFSVEAVELLIRVGVPAWKMASGEVNNIPMFERIAETGLPILLSTGMSRLGEIDTLVRDIRQRGLPFLVFQTTSVYPTVAEKIGLNLIPFFRERYECPVGLSDHSGTTWPGLAAAAIGVEAVEVHITLSREMSGPDVAASITTEELRQLVAGIRFVERMRGSPVDKDLLAQELQPMREIFTKSIVARVNLRAGTILTKEHVAVKKPGTGLPATRLSKLIGRRLRRDVAPDELVHECDFEEVPD